MVKKKSQHKLNEKINSGCKTQVLKAILEETSPGHAVRTQYSIEPGTSTVHDRSSTKDSFNLLFKWKPSQPSKIPAK